MSETSLYWIDYKKGLSHVQEKLAQQITKGSSFSVVNIPTGHQRKVVILVENMLEKAGFSCRVRSCNRAWLAVGLSVATLGVGALSLVAIAGHDLATRNPDYEILKELIGTDITVVRRK